MNIFGDSNLKDILNHRKDPMWKYTECTEPRYVMECPLCHKHTWLEVRFIKPLLPKTIKCPYCDEEVTFHPEEKTDESDES